MRISDWSSDVCSSDLRVAKHRLDRAQERFAYIRIMLRQNLQADMVLGNALHRGSQSREIVDVACVSENSGRQRARLRARVAMMRLIDRKSGGSGKGVLGRIDIGGGRFIKNNNK